jgi:hypothetical protein
MRARDALGGLVTDTDFTSSQFAEMYSCSGDRACHQHDWSW